MSKYLFALVFACVCLASCSGTQALNRGDNQNAAITLTPAEREMAKKGQNAFGVPPITFAFYPDNYVPVSKSVGGYLPGNMNDPFYRDFVLGGGKFTPENAPIWDTTYRDAPGTKYDFVSISKLAEIHWGTKPTELGYLLNDSADLSNTPITLPAIVSATTTEVVLEDLIRNKYYRISLNDGKMIEIPKLPPNSDNQAKKELGIESIEEYNKVIAKIPENLSLNFLKLYKMQSKYIGFTWTQDPPASITIYSDDLSRIQSRISFPLFETNTHDRCFQTDYCSKHELIDMGCFCVDQNRIVGSDAYYGLVGYQPKPISNDSIIHLRITPKSLEIYLYHLHFDEK